MLTLRVLTLTFLKIFLRDRQAIFFSLFFPVVFMGVFGFLNDAEPEPLTLGLVDAAGTAEAEALRASLGANPAFAIRVGSEENLRTALQRGDLSLVLVVPPGFGTGTTEDLRVLVDAAQQRQLDLILPVLEQALVQVERDLRGQEALFRLRVEDVEARSQRYLDFLVPGLLAFSLMQLSVAGSGYNLVEFRRKGILKRLFVTPLQPRDFILALVFSRALIVLVQLSLLLAIAVFWLDVNVDGDALALLLCVTLGTALFLALGFCIGSLAKSQQTVIAIGNLVIFPQIFLAGVFYPLDALPALLQPLAGLLPLAFLVDGLRAVLLEGAGLGDLSGSLAGLSAWLLLFLFLAVRLFRWKEVAG